MSWQEGSTGFDDDGNPVPTCGPVPPDDEGHAHDNQPTPAEITRRVVRLFANAAQSPKTCGQLLKVCSHIMEHDDRNQRQLAKTLGVSEARVTQLVKAVATILPSVHAGFVARRRQRSKVPAHQ